MNTFWIEWAKELQSIAQAGLTYGKDSYDKERYQRIRDISAEILSEYTDIPTEKIKTLFCNESGYQTPKIDTRAAVFDDNKILLVHEANGTWSLPGGWCDIDCSPADNTIKEVKEESGLDVTVDMIISVQDRDKHNSPKYAYSITKIFYLCSLIGGNFIPNIETTGFEWFSLENLPELAEEKCNSEQIAMCFDAYHSENWKTQFD